MLQKLLITYILFTSFFLFGCVSGTINIDSTPESKVSLHTWNDIDGIGEAVGKTPVNLKQNDIEMKILKFETKGYGNQYIAFLPETKSSMNLKFNLQKGGGGGIDPGQAITFSELNKVNRNIMNIIQAYKNDQFVLMEKSSLQMAKENDKLSVPHIMAALAKINLGKIPEAVESLKKAIEIDPDDKEIAKLLSQLQ